MITIIVMAPRRSEKECVIKREFRCELCFLGIEIVELSYIWTRNKNKIKTILVKELT